MRILLLNPPGERLYLRDYFCSKVSQANYISQPIDFLVISGLLCSTNGDVFLVDSIAEKLSPEDTLRRISGINPDVIISLAGAVSWKEDRSFLKRVKALCAAKLLVCGDIFQQDAEEFLARYDFLDAIILDFTSFDLVNYLKGSTGSFSSIVYRHNGKITSANPAPRGLTEFSLPGNPRHELFLKFNYRHPFALEKKYCSVLTQYGCPFKCVFCIMGKLPYKCRKPEEVLSELSYISSLGVREIFFVDQTFGADRPKTIRLLSEMIRQKLNISWFGFSRVDVLDQELLDLMKESGCHTLILGVESGSSRLLAKYRKGYDKPRILSIVNACNRRGIKTVGTFILGLPDETEETANETLDFLKELPLDYASFNVAVPRAGTDLRKEALASGLIDDESITMDQSGTEIAMPTKHLTQAQVRTFRRKAVRQFYLRPGYILRRLRKIKSWHEFAQNITNAIWLLRNTWDI